MHINKMVFSEFRKYMDNHDISGMKSLTNQRPQLANRTWQYKWDTDRSEIHYTPLLYVLEKQYPLELAQELINLGADVNGKAHDGSVNTPFKFCFHNCNVELLKLLVANNVNLEDDRWLNWDKPINNAAEDFIRVLIASGAEIYSYDTPLRLAESALSGKPDTDENIKKYKNIVELLRNAKNGIFPSREEAGLLPSTAMQNTQHIAEIYQDELGIGGV